MNLSGWYNGFIGARRKVVDISRLEIRPKVTEADLARYYDECIAKLRNYPHYFADQRAFEKTLEDIADEKRAKLVAREPRYPGYFQRHSYRRNLINSTHNPLHKKDEGYFCIPGFKMPKQFFIGSQFEKLYDPSIAETMKYPDAKPEYSALIKIPDDMTQSGARVSTIHETLHYFVYSYQLESRRLFTDDEDIVKAFMEDHALNKTQMLVIENLVHESAVIELTDLLLEDDKEVLFEHRWAEYCHYNEVGNRFLNRWGDVLTGLMIGTAVVHFPPLLPLAVVPHALRIVLYYRYKKTKKEEVTQPKERKMFKI